MPPVFMGWYYNGRWNNAPSPEWVAKFDAYLLSRGAKKIKELDPNFNYVEHLNKMVELRKTRQ